MKKPHLHFAHANGIPSGTYNLMFEKLESHYQTSNLPMFGHDEKYPITNNWTALTQQLIDSIVLQSKEPVIGVGHSLGGATMMMASIARPDLFKGVILLDVPTFSLFEAMFVRVAKMAGFIDHLTPAKKSKNRRTQWPDRETAFSYLRSRKLFSTFHERCFEDYVEHGLKPDHGLEQESQSNVTLAFNLESELAIFRTVPNALHLKKKKLQVPMGIIVGNRTQTVRKGQYIRMKSKLGFTGMRVNGTHMFPLEYPVDTAGHIHQMIQRMGIV